jgi:hypothetical protein
MHKDECNGNGVQDVVLLLKDVESGYGHKYVAIDDHASD